MRTVEAMLTCPWCGELCETTEQRVHVHCHVAELDGYKEAIQAECEAKRALAASEGRNLPVVAAACAWSLAPSNQILIDNLLEVMNEFTAKGPSNG